MMSNAQIIRYDPEAFPFRAILEQSIFCALPLEQLHVHWRRTKRRRQGTGQLGYSDNLVLRKLMQDQPDDSPLLRVYHHFVRQVIRPPMGCAISYSNRPKMRVHLAGTETVSKWHRDVDITHRPDQLNVFLPFTRCVGGAALWCESAYGAGDYQSVPLEVGEALIFDGGMLAHGSTANDTDITRCSLDFRFAPLLPAELAWPYSQVLAGRPAVASNNVSAVVQENAEISAQLAHAARFE